MTIHLWGQEQLVNVATTGNQLSPSIARLTDGDLIIAWADTSGATSDIHARLYAPDGTARGGELILAATAASDVNPTVIALAGGDFQLLYESGGVVKTPTFHSDGTPDGAAPTSYVGGSGDTAGAAYGGGKGFVDVLTFGTSGSGSGKDVELDRFDATGAFTGFSSVSSAAGDQINPDVTVLSGGRIAVVWSEADNQVKARLFESNGAAVGAEFAVNASGSGAGYDPTVAALEGGGFVVTWTDYNGVAPSAAYDIRGQMYTSAGAAVGGTFLVNSHLLGSQYYGDVVGLPDGGFLSVWYDGYNGVVRAQQFDVLGGREGGEFTVGGAPYGGLGVRSLDATLMADGRVAVSWDTFGEGHGDASGYGTYLQIIDPRDGNVTGTSAADVLYGGDSADFINGLGGADVIHAGYGDDVVYGGAGNDTLYGDGGLDLLYGGDGADTFAYGSVFDSTAAAFDTIADFATGVDRIDVSAATGAGGAVSINRYGENSVVGFQGASGPQGAVLVHGVVQGFDLVLGANTTVYIAGSDAAETLFGSSGSDVIYGQGGDDIISGGFGADTLFGGPGADTFYYFATSDSTAAAFDTIVDFASGVDRIDVSSMGAGGAVSINRNGAASVVAFQGAAGPQGVILVDAAVQAFDVKTGPNTTIYVAGSQGDNVLFGSIGNDVLYGLGGNDSLIAGFGADTLTGGGGADTFIYYSASDSTNAAYDTITDFQTGLDKIDLRLVHTSAADSYSLAVSGGNTYLYLDQGGNGTIDMFIVLAGVTNVQNSDILF